MVLVMVLVMERVGWWEKGGRSVDVGLGTPTTESARSGD